MNLGPTSIVSYLFPCNYIGTRPWGDIFTMFEIYLTVAQKERHRNATEVAEKCHGNQNLIPLSLHQIDQRKLIYAGNHSLKNK